MEINSTESCTTSRPPISRVTPINVATKRITKNKQMETLIPQSYARGSFIIDFSDLEG